MAGTTPPIPDSSGMLVRPKKPKKLSILDRVGRGPHPGMAGKKPQIPGMFRPILPPGSEGQAVLGPAVGPTTPTKDVLQGAMLAMQIPDRVGDEQKKRMDWFGRWARQNRGRLERDPRFGGPMAKMAGVIPDRVGDERRRRDPRTIFGDMERARRDAMGRDGGIAAWETPSRIPEPDYGAQSRGGWSKPSQGLSDPRNQRRRYRA